MPPPCRRPSEPAPRRLATIVGSASEAIIAWSLDAEITDWNPGAERLYGYTAEEAIGQSIELFTPPARHAAARERQQRVLREGVIETFEATRITKDGREIEVAATASPMRNSRDEIVGAMGISRDITEQRRQEQALELSERRFRELAESAPVGILALDAAERLTFANSELERITGYSAERLAGRRLARHHSSGRPRTDRRRRSTRAAPSSGSSSACGARRGGSHHRGEGETEPGSRRRGHGRLASVVDVTRDRDQSGELARSNAELEQFAYVASHDLQEPLRVIGGFVELLRDRYEGQLDEDADRFIAATVSGVERMSQLIDDLLAYSRAGRSEIVREEVDSAATVDSVLDRLAEPIAENGVEVRRGDLPTVSGDAGMLDQIFQNLISNAVKFADGEHPRLEIDGSEDDGGWHFVVADNGPGIDPRHRDQIFEMFKRLHGRSVPGTGIGLAISKRIAERHGGRIWVEPAADGGSAFNFTISR